MGAYGCFGVCMGALGYTNAKPKANNTKRGINELSRVRFPAMCGREISQKRHICVCRHKMGKEGLRRVGIGSNGCRGMHIHAANAKNTNRDTDMCVGHNFDKVWGKQNHSKTINEGGT